MKLLKNLEIFSPFIKPIWLSTIIGNIGGNVLRVLLTLQNHTIQGYWQLQIMFLSVTFIECLIATIITLLLIKFVGRPVSDYFIKKRIKKILNSKTLFESSPRPRGIAMNHMHQPRYQFPQPRPARNVLPSLRCPLSTSLQTGCRNWR